MKALRYLLFPFSIAYGLVVWLRNKCFDWGLFTSHVFSLPLIGIGNLSTGGTGKSVVVDYILHHFQSKYRLATLSRGYGRKTKGFRKAQEGDSALTLGDEPYQFFQKYADVCVAVAEKRVTGVRGLLSESPRLHAIVLDDVYQHRWISPSLSILTTTYQAPYNTDRLLPVGNLREARSGSQRADIILVTKTPNDASPIQRQQMIASLHLLPNQTAYCCKIAYSKRVTSQNETLPWSVFKKNPFLLVTGIANDAPLIQYFNVENAKFEHLSFPDHFNYSSKAIKRIMETAKKCPILTTEKDFGRLKPLLPHTVSLYYIPIEMAFFSNKEETSFLSQIENILSQKN